MPVPAPAVRLMPTFTAHEAQTLVRNFGAYDAVMSFAELVTANDAGDREISIEVPITMTADLELTSALRMLQGGLIITNGYQLTLMAPFSAGASQAFDAAAGDIIFGTDSTLYVLLEWFGATGDGTTNDTAAIQLALDAAVSGARVPVLPLSNKIYALTSVTVPARTTILSDMGRTSGAKFLGLAASAMFVLPQAYSENQITFRGGFTIDGNNDATVGIDTGFASGLVIDGVGFMYCDIFIDHTGGGIINWIHRCRFTGDFQTAIKIGGIANAVHIDECMFAGDGDYVIETDNTWVGDNLHITNCTFDAAGITDSIKIARLNNGTPTMHFVISGCRFDGGTSSSHINIGQYCYGNIESCGLSGGSGFPGMVINGDEVTVSNNYFGNVGITLGANSRFCIINPQKWGGFSPHFTDAGTLNIINPYDAGSVRRIGTTAQRPTLLATGMFGYQYLDTTLDADGKVIFWNGTAWVDSTGAVV
jgi:hypothetical protein